MLSKILLKSNIQYANKNNNKINKQNVESNHHIIILLILSLKTFASIKKQSPETNNNEINIGKWITKNR